MEALVTLLQHADWSVRNAAASAFGQLDKSAQEQDADALVALLQHADSGVRNAAAPAFVKLDKSVQEQHK